MLIYHGSDISVTQPRILPANRLLDFGEGFYTTSSLEQAKRWALRVMERRSSRTQIISFYEFDEPKAQGELNIMQFDSPSSQWLNFVTACRMNKNAEHGYDIVMGPVANDNVYATIQLYETGLLSETETIIRLKVEEIYDQILFHTEKALQYCTFIKSEEVKS